VLKAIAPVHGLLADRRNDWHNNFGIAGETRPDKLSQKMALVYDLFDQANALAKKGDDQDAIAGFASLLDGLAEATGSERQSWLGRLCSTWGTP
jgi:hypothetical protein